MVLQGCQQSHHRQPEEQQQQQTACQGLSFLPLLLLLVA
jgi:hypothetical protein